MRRRVWDAESLSHETGRPLTQAVLTIGTREEERPTKGTNITKGVKFVPFVQIRGKNLFLRFGTQDSFSRIWPPAHAGGSDIWDAR